MSTPVKEETPEVIAERIAKKATRNPCANPSCCPNTARVASEILSALRNEREARDARAVRIIDEHQALDVCLGNCWEMIRKAIRGRTE